MIRVFLMLLLLSTQVKPAHPKFAIDDSGRWSLPLRYWSHETPLESTGSYAFMAEVAKLGPEVPPAEKQELPLRFRSGILKVHELLSPRPADSLELSKVRELAVEGMEGLEVGDRVIAFVDPEPYEGGYVINYHEGGCHVGIRLPPADDLDFGAEPQQHLLKTIRDGRTSLRQFTAEELSAWIVVDPTGVARQFQKELDMKTLQWRDSGK